MDNSTIYESFNWDALTESHLKGKIQKVLEIIPTDVETIADVGCGNGVITNVLGQKYKVTGVDRSHEALKSVNTEKIQASADDIPLPSDSFDLVFSSELLEHLPDNVLSGTTNELKRLSKRYLFITVPNDENPDKLAIKCPECSYVYNSPNHLRSFTQKKIVDLFKDFNLVTSFVYGKKVRYYNRFLLKQKLKLCPNNSWIPYYWMPKNKRKTICPSCEHEFENLYKFHLLALVIDIINVIISPKKPYWLFALLEKK